MSENGLPKGWSRLPLGDTGKYINGVAFRPEDWGDRGSPIIRIQNLTDASKPYNRTTRQVAPDYLVKSGNILVSWSATLDAFVWRGETAVLNQHIFKVVPDLNVVHPAYLFYLLRYTISEMKNTEHLHGSTMKHINRGPFLGFRAPVAPLPEQHRIVDEIEKQFSRLDAGVAALKRTQANLKRYRASVLQAACEGRLVPTEAELAKGKTPSPYEGEGRGEGGRSQQSQTSGTPEQPYEPADKLLQRILAERRAKWNGKGKYKEPAVPNTSDLPELPEGWCWASADELTTVITDGEHATPERSDSGVYLLSARNVLNGRLALDDVDYVPEPVYEQLTRRLTVNEGDVLLSCSGSVGRSCVAPPNVRFALVRSVAVLKPVLRMGLYISYALRSLDLQQQIDTLKTQTAQANIFQGKIKVLMLPLAPLAEQHRIVAEVERRLSVIDQLESVVEANLKRAERLRQAILKRAFEGKLVAQDQEAY